VTSRTPGSSASGDPTTTPHVDAPRPARLAPAFDGAALDVVAIADGTGAIVALRELFVGLPDGFPAAVVVLLHWPADKLLKLGSLERRSVLPITLAEEGQSLRPASVFLAPPGRHLLIKPNGSFALTETPRVHFVRPSADLLFASLAATCGHRAIAVILSGSGSDGSVGVRFIRAAGGTVIAQNWATAEQFPMPLMPIAAIHTGCVDHVLPIQQIAPSLVSLVNQYHSQ